jgi:hypothetical protein
VSGGPETADTLLVLNAEAANALRIYQPEPGQPARLLGEVRTPAPDRSAVVDWPGWGETLAVTQKMGADVHFFPGLSRVADQSPSPMTVSVSDRPRRVAGLAVADLDGDGRSTVLVTVPNAGEMFAIDPVNKDAIDAKPLRSFDRKERIHLILPVKFDGDDSDDLLLLGETSPVLHLLLGSGGEHALDLADDGFVAAQLSREPDNSLLLWAASDTALHLVVWSSSSIEPSEHRIFPQRGLGRMRLAVSDLDADGVDDLVIGSSVGGIPLSVVYGPLRPQADGIGRWLSRLTAKYEDS